jgi:hypothetical protein
MGEVRNAYNILIRKPEGKNHLEDLGVDGGMIFKMDLRQVPVADSSEHGNEPSASIKCGKFLD